MTWEFDNWKSKHYEKNRKEKKEIVQYRLKEIVRERNEREKRKRCDGDCISQGEKKGKEKATVSQIVMTIVMTIVSQIVMTIVSQIIIN